MLVKLAIGMLILSGLILLLFLGLGWLSQNKSDTIGLSHGKLAPCPNKPNCVCSESYTGKQAKHAISAIKTSEKELPVAWKQIRDSIKTNGGIIIAETDTYLHAEFTSTFFRFVDDVEIRLNRAPRQIHLRSASRMGHSDFGANRKRIETIKSDFRRHP